MTTTPGLWRKRKELLWSGYYPGKRVESKPDLEREELLVFLALYINYFMSLQPSYEQSDHT